ncbi:hypothetical protein HOLleu_23655 [Holothuria leucospilota]|uniref:CCHC-type domain-containing protein n=1 Tax=Holothuria leucospilota TaxID=206669 RepID=A0A9Q1H5Q2_HOLLE|nr:hypothetical protein HOLleu_23655 [Holothuria leucospilota]
MTTRSTIGSSIDPYDSQIETWTEYAERMEQCFIGNDTEEPAKKKAIFLSSVGPKTYKLIKTLIAPEKPCAKSFTELVKLVKDHECPRPSAIVQRFKFNNKKQQPGESVSAFVADLKRLAEFCEYGPALEEMLRDRIVCGIADVPTQRRLLGEKDLKFNRALEITLAMETTVKQANDLKGQDNVLHAASNNNMRPSVNKLGHSGVESKSVSSVSSRRRVTNLQGCCYRCGSKNHNGYECRHVNTECHNCHLQGHLAAVCRKPKQGGKSPGVRNHKVKSHATNELDTSEQEEHEALSLAYDLYVLGNKPDTALKTKVIIEGKPVIMEIDTGAAVSVMAEVEFMRL